VHLDAPVAFDGSVATNLKSRYRPTVGTKGMVVSDDRVANEWGAEILRKDGNSVDAAVATAFALAVTRPYYASLGGGGFLVHCPPEGKKCVALDYRERAPKAATRDMYVKNGKADSDLSSDGALAPGVPGVTAGLVYALKRWGTMPLSMVLKRPIELARQGYRFTGFQETGAQSRWEAMNEPARKIFGCEGKPCPSGTLIKQPDLARVLEEIARKGTDGFYRGWVARSISAGVRKAGGIITEQDLADYRPTEREPVSGVVRGYEITSMPPPSAGGAMILQILGYLDRAERDGALDQGYGAAKSVHAIAHALGLAFADRAEVFGDPDFVKVPLAELLSDDYLDRRWKTFRSGHAALPERSGLPAPGGAPASPGGEHATSQTTHFSVVDRNGGAVALTTTLNDYYGSGFVPQGTGVLLNDEMDDFSIQPGHPNMYGLVGAEANAIAPGKRPLSSMAPTIVRDSGGRVRIVLGAQGGPRITSSVALVLANRIFFGLSLPDAVVAPRVHEQWKPETLDLEPVGYSEDTREKLRSLGYAVATDPGLAKIHALERFPNGRVWGVADPRGEGSPVAE
jgi:gamma-glutamyltranspeptidase/glutathione hydrolase